MINLPKDIEYIITDFDGVMTDNYIYISDNSKEHTMRLNFRDIMGISIAIKNIPNIQITESNGGNGAFREIVDALVG